MHDFLSSLNNEQQKSIHHLYGPALILAGAGSGKTRVLTYRAANLILTHNISPYHILLVTFTNKAAEEMKKRIKNILAQSQQKATDSFIPYASTFHSFCVRVLRIDGQAINLPQDFVIYDDQDQIDAIREVMKDLNISMKNFHPANILHTISQAKNELISATEYPQYAHGYFQQTVARVYGAYQTLLRNNHAIDFDDILSLTVYLFQNHDAIKQKYQEKYQFIMIDEYQDTNKAQYALTKLLAEKHRNIAVVGDAAQSIYLSLIHI